MTKIIAFFVALIFIFAGCKESSTVEPASGNEGTSLEKSYHVSGAVLAELQALKAATAKYHNIENAIADGYADINAVIPGMGHHFLKASLMDTNFELTKPELLVYTLHENGRYELVAIEYGTPLTPGSTPPEGFTGDDDVWVANTGAGIWALHAWVWKYNPSGVFNGTNPNVP